MAFFQKSLADFLLGGRGGGHPHSGKNPLSSILLPPLVMNHQVEKGIFFPFLSVSLTTHFLQYKDAFLSLSWSMIYLTREHSRQMKVEIFEQCTMTHFPFGEVVFAVNSFATC